MVTSGNIIQLLSLTVCTLLSFPSSLAVPRVFVGIVKGVAYALAASKGTPAQCALWRIIDKPKYRKFCL